MVQNELVSKNDIAWLKAQVQKLGAFDGGYSERWAAAIVVTVVY
jgi:hypothetical protein